MHTADSALRSAATDDSLHDWRPNARATDRQSCSERRISEGNQGNNFRVPPSSGRQIDVPEFAVVSVPEALRGVFIPVSQPGHKPKDPDRRIARRTPKLDDLKRGHTLTVK
ncbi:hypothetical protein Ari01nite_97450 [Paractinoplanes rishiriensis]|uniref:Uncharacterized protein n=1 Tax=Paractinoplanes rishiriensis TaxID=1050105 RepID=A0A919KB77_9ACTN|nr:hypothetical protein Ari01nite_97450 [Actinoplanes rishiriensis]